MLILNKSYKAKVTFLLLVLALNCGNYYFCPISLADSNDLNFKVYNPDQSNSADASSSNANSSTTESASPGLAGEKPSLAEEKPVNDANEIIDQATAPEKGTQAIKEAKKTSTGDSETGNKSNAITADKANDSINSNSEGENKTKVLQGYVRIVPSGTKMAIIMDTAVDSDTSQEGDEFSARTAEDLTIDGTTVVPAGSIIKGRIATLNAPKHLNRSGSVALKFDSVTTPDNRQIPLVANLVARGGVVHARRGIRDIAIDTATFTLPTAVALGIGAVAGHSSSSVGIGGGALIGAGVGAVIGLAILMAKKGKRVDVRPGDELKIELAEDLHMPTM